MAHELADDDIYTSALTGAARVWGALSATADEPTSFGREAIINTAKDGLARVATTGSASDLSSGTIPLDRLHAFLQDIANISFSNGDLIYFNGTDLIRLPVGTAAQVLTVVSGVPAWTTQPYVDVEEAVADAQAAAAAAGVSAAEALASASAASAHAANAAAANLLINGDFNINQRQFGGGTLASSAYGFDRWRAASGGCSISVSGYVVSLASGGIEQYIEPSMMGVASLASTQITISVEDPSQNMSVVVGSVGDTITAGSGRRSTTITTAAGDTGNLRVYLARASGSGVTFGRVKAEIGASATAWQPRPREVEMALCRRYFQTTYADGMPGGSATSAGTMQCIVSLSVTAQGIRWPFGPMRAAPTLTIWNTAGTLGQGSSFNGNGPKALTPSSISTQGVWYFGGSGMSVGDFYDIHFHASAEF